MRCSRVTFLCGRAGVSALGAVVAKHIGDQSLLNNYLEQFKEVLYLVIYHQDLMIFLIFTWCPDFKLFFNCFSFGKQIRLPNDLPNELLYGRAGYLWACSFLNKHIGKDTISTTDMVRNMCLMSHDIIPLEFI